MAGNGMYQVAENVVAPRRMSGGVEAEEIKVWQAKVSPHLIPV